MTHIYKRLHKTKSRCTSYVSTHANTAIVPFTKIIKKVIMGKTCIACIRNIAIKIIDSIQL